MEQAKGGARHLDAATTPQHYNSAATSDAGGNLRLDGGGSSYAGGATTVGAGHEIVIQGADLTAGIYSANLDYTVDGASAHIGKVITK